MVAKWPVTRSAFGDARPCTAGQQRDLLLVGVRVLAAAPEAGSRTAPPRRRSRCRRAAGCTRTSRCGSAVWRTMVAPSSRPLVAVGALPVGPDRALVEQRDPTRAGPGGSAGCPPGRSRRPPPCARHLARGAVLLAACATPTARSPSNSTSSTRTPSCASTPCSRALSSIIWSNSLRTTCQVCEHSCGLLSQK